jgi:hypothetical protein
MQEGYNYDAVIGVSRASGPSLEWCVECRKPETGSSKVQKREKDDSSAKLNFVWLIAYTMGSFFYWERKSGSPW